MAWAEFSKTREWAQLSVRQQMFVQTYVASGDRVLATTCAYETSSKENTKVFSYSLIKKSAIVNALNRYYNRGPREIFIQELDSDIQATEPGSPARIELQKLKAQVLLGGKLPRKRGAR
jgi:type VI protein secretion system component VasK